MCRDVVLASISKCKIDAFVGYIGIQRLVTLLVF